MSNSSELCFVPPPLPDELLYSLLGRLGALNTLGSPRTRMQLFFGSSSKMPSVDLPTGLLAMQKRLGTNSPWCSAVELIEKGTIYPYHRPFLTVERHKTAEKMLLYGDGKGLKTVIGRVANRFGAAPPLRYCSACTQADILNHGVPYWHRAHQLPGVTSCHLHGLMLIDHPGAPSTDRQRIVLAPALCSSELRDHESDPLQTSFAVLSNELLNIQLPALAAEHRRRTYFDELVKLGFVVKNHVDYQSLAVAIREHYGDFSGFLHCQRLLASKARPLYWLRPLVDRPSQASHPICHLLLIGYLFRTADNFREALAADRSSEHIPQIAQENRNALHPTLSQESFQPVLLNPAVSCREAARQLNLSVSTIVKRRRVLGVMISTRPKTLDSDRLAPILQELMQGASPQQVANDHKISLSTAYRLRAQFPTQIEAHATKSLETELEIRRAQWLDLVQQNSSLSVTNARAIAGSTYAWLYRHDRKWLQEKVALFRGPRTTPRRVDWESRDRCLCEAVSDFVSKVMSQTSRPRISRTLMLRHVNQALVRANMVRLPQLSALLERSEETPMAYQCYKIDCAIKWLAKNNVPIVIWRVRRIAGIRQWGPTHTAYWLWKAQRLEHTT